MKTLRLISCSGFFVLCMASSLYAQQVLKVNVTSGKEPLSYAFVFINGVFFGSADSIGVANIPITLLHKGDTLMTSFLGAQASAIYNDVTQSQISIDIKTDFSLNEVTVLAKDKSEQYFLKYVKQRYIGIWGDEYRGDLTIVFPDHKVVTGRFMKAFLTNSYLKTTKEQDVVIEKDSHPELSSQAKNFVSYINFAVEAALVRSSSIRRRIYVIKYLGEKNGLHQFFLTRDLRIPISQDPFNYQIMLYSDAVTKDIISSTISIGNKADGFSLDMTASYAYSKKFKRLYPVSVKADLVLMKDGRANKYDIKLDNLTIKKYSVTKIPQSKQI